MSKFTLIASALATSALLAACGSGGGGNSVTTNLPIPESEQTLTKIDTVISSPMHTQSVLGPIAVDIQCSGTVCRDHLTRKPVDLLKDWDSNAIILQRNGKVNGHMDYRETRTVNGELIDTTSYAYWMGDSAFMVVDAESDTLTGQLALATGNNTGSRPTGDARYSGKAVAIQVNNNEAADGFPVGHISYGDFHATYHFQDRTIDMGLDFGWYGEGDGDYDIVFKYSSVNPDGSFTGRNNNGGSVKGNFFGSNHKEVAGTFDSPEDNVVGSFGGIKY